MSDIPAWQAHGYENEFDYDTDRLSFTDYYKKYLMDEDLQRYRKLIASGDTECLMAEFKDLTLKVLALEDPLHKVRGWINQNRRVMQLVTELDRIDLKRNAEEMDFSTCVEAVILLANKCLSYQREEESIKRWYKEESDLLRQNPRMQSCLPEIDSVRVIQYQGHLLLEKYWYEISCYIDRLKIDISWR